MPRQPHQTPPSPALQSPARQSLAIQSRARLSCAIQSRARLSRTPITLALLTLSLLLARPFHASAQAIDTASRIQRFAVFLEGTSLAPDYGTNRNFGVTVGADYTRHYHLLNAGLEGRITHAGGDVAGETSYMGGLRGSRDYGHLHPYADFLIGYGKVTFTHPNGTYASDNSTIFGAGGGADYDVFGPLSIRGEFQYQSWKPGKDARRVTPTAISFGVVYHIPIRH